jgi:hypothetical protein
MVLSSFSFAQNIDLNKGIPRRQLLHEIQFEYVNGKIINTILMKTYRFLLDTGAPNLITKKT